VQILLGSSRKQSEFLDTFCWNESTNNITKIKKNQGWYLIAHGSILTEWIFCGKHGYYTKVAMEERKMINQLLLKVRDTIAEIK